MVWDNGTTILRRRLSSVSLISADRRRFVVGIEDSRYVCCGVCDRLDWKYGVFISDVRAEILFIHLWMIS